MNEKKVATLSAFCYTGISLIVAGAFYLLASIADHNAVTRYGGAAWVFILSMIITMPVIIPLIKKRYSE